MDDEVGYYVGFSHCLGIGPMRFQKLIEYFKSVKQAYTASVSQLTEVLGAELAQKFVDSRKKFDHHRKLAAIIAANIHVLTRTSDTYPAPLRNLADAPICLYAKGDLRTIDFVTDFFFGIVGTRNPTSYGRQITTQFAGELASAGAVIVSGLAIGVDGAAHAAALAAKGKTVAFLGCGVDIKYPGYNSFLYDQIVDGGGLVISEFPPGMQPLRGFFVTRNRLISGLSHGLLVIEGTEKSGTLITAKYAAEQGKDVFAPPVPLTSSLSQAPNILLKQGAQLVTNVRDILDQYKIVRTVKQVQISLSPPETVIYNLLAQEPLMADDIVATAQVSVTDLLSTLSTLEVKGFISKNQEGKYQII